VIRCWGIAQSNSNSERKYYQDDGKIIIEKIIRYQFLSLYNIKTVEESWTVEFRGVMGAIIRRARFTMEHLCRESLSLGVQQFCYNQYLLNFWLD
jgi:hypothetical protein